MEHTVLQYIDYHYNIEPHMKYKQPGKCDEQTERRKLTIRQRINNDRVFTSSHVSSRTCKSFSLGL